ncbi:GNAT family N-acetyltransferase [Streptomyces sp. cmx-4-9]|uniref:GNAT family N-acetyltransferase n=1 Tax=Streptomyces sp. cmx-4-9 TaxID=2790941 RepID=UPI003980C7BF
MTWTFTRDLAAYLSAAGPCVAAQPVSNTVLLTTADALERRGPRAFGRADPFFGWWTGPDGSVAGGLLCTPPFPLLVGALPEGAVRALAACLDTEPLLADISGFNARRADAGVLAAAWRRPSRVAVRNRLYRLGRLTDPDPAPAGRARAAGEGDLPLLLEWVEAFNREAGQPGAASPAALRERIGYGGALLWEDAGAPVALASFTRPGGRGCRIGPVYTPPACRRRGYAAAVTHAASRAAMAAGAGQVLLFTDLANATSNGVYLRLGFVAVEDRTEVLAA